MVYRSVLGRQVVELSTQGYEQLDARLKSVFVRMRGIEAVNDRINRQARSGWFSGMGGGFGGFGGGGFGGGGFGMAGRNSVGGFFGGLAGAAGLARFGSVAGVGAGLGAAGYGAIRTMGDFQQQLAEIKKTTGASEVELARFKEGIMDLASEMRVSRSDLATISALAGQQGLSNPAENLKFTRSTAMMAATSDMSPEQASTMAAQILNVFKMTVGQVDNLNSMLTKMASQTTATEGQLSDVMLRAGGTGQMIGLSPQQVAAVAATLKDLGVSGEVAGTSLSQMFTIMATGLKDLAKVTGLSETGMKQLVSTSPWQAFMKINEQLAKMDQFKRAEAINSLSLDGMRAFTVAEKLSSNLEMLNKNMNLSNQAFAEGNAHIQEYTDGTDTLYGKMAQLGNAIQNLPEKMEGSGLIQWLEDATEKATALVNALPRNFSGPEVRQDGFWNSLWRAGNRNSPKWMQDLFGEAQAPPDIAAELHGIMAEHDIINEQRGGRRPAAETVQPGFGISEEFAAAIEQAASMRKQSQMAASGRFLIDNLVGPSSKWLAGQIEILKHRGGEMKNLDKLWAQADTPDPGWVVDQNREKKQMIEDAAKEIASLQRFTPQVFNSGVEAWLSQQQAALSDPGDEKKALKDIRDMIKASDMVKHAGELRRQIQGIVDSLRSGKLIVAE